MADAAPAAGSDLLLEVIEDCQTPDDDSLVLELFARVHSPRMRFLEQRNRRVRRRGSGTDMLERFRHLTADLMAIADEHLRQDARRSDLYGRYRRLRQAIEPHQQDRDPDPLVDAARNLLDIQIQDNPEAAAAQIQAWEKSRWPILRRLALYGHTARSDTTQDTKLTVLIESPDLLVDHELHHEAMSLIAATLPAASPSVVDQLIAAVRDHETSDTIRLNKLGWIARHATGSQTAQAAFDAEQAAHPDLRMFGHPDFLHWIGSHRLQRNSRLLPGRLAGPGCAHARRPGGGSRSSCRALRRPGPRLASQPQVVRRARLCSGGDRRRPSKRACRYSKRLSHTNLHAWTPWRQSQPRRSYVSTRQSDKTTRYESPRTSAGCAFASGAPPRTAGPSPAQAHQNATGHKQRGTPVRGCLPDCSCRQSSRDNREPAPTTPCCGLATL